MREWQADLLMLVESDQEEQRLFDQIAATAKQLGFDYCAYGARMAYPLAVPQLRLWNNYPQSWQDCYQHHRYIQTDPTVEHGRRSRAPIVWSDAVFAKTPELWADARDHGLRVGWAQSTLDPQGVCGMLTLARAHNPLSDIEINDRAQKMHWLTQICHFAMSHRMTSKMRVVQNIELTKREREVLQWTADGKTSGEMAEILNLSEHTINFHLKNAICKLKTANKTAAVIKAARLGLLE